MQCEECKRRIVLHAFSEGKCELCGETVITSHMPCDKLCEKCSEEARFCQSCGKDVE